MQSDKYFLRILIMEIAIRTEMIRLGQFLKHAAIVESGSEAKAIIQGGEVMVNGEVETRRGRQLHPGDRVIVGSENLIIIHDSSA